MNKFRTDTTFKLGEIISSDNRLKNEVIVMSNFTDFEEDYLWRMVEQGFRGLNENSVIKQGASREEFLGELATSSVINLVLRTGQSGRPKAIGYMGIHTSTERLTWLDERLLGYFSEAEKDGTFFYNTAIVIDQEHRSLSTSMLFLSAGIRYVFARAAMHGKTPTVGFDFCRKNDAGVPNLMQLSLKRERLPLTIETLARSDWYTLKPGIRYSGGVEPRPMDKVVSSEVQTGVTLKEIKNSKHSQFSQQVSACQRKAWHIKGPERLKDRRKIPQLVSEIVEQVARFGPEDTGYINIDSSYDDVVLSLASKIRTMGYEDCLVEQADYQKYNVIRGG
jgi:hypothetical protein